MTTRTLGTLIAAAILGGGIAAGCAMFDRDEPSSDTSTSPSSTSGASPSASPYDSTTSGAAPSASPQ